MLANFIIENFVKKFIRYEKYNNKHGKRVEEILMNISWKEFVFSLNLEILLIRIIFVIRHALNNFIYCISKGAVFYDFPLLIFNESHKFNHLC